MPDVEARAVLDDSARGWLLRTARKNLWRVHRWYDFDDLVSDGVLCWQIVVTRYAQVSERKHLMSLFKTTYLNHIHQLANKRTLQSAELVDTDLLPFCELGQRDDMMEIAQSATPALRRCLSVVMEQPERLRQPYRRRLNGHRETVNERLCRFAGVDPKKFNLHQQLCELLGSKLVTT